MSLVIPSGQASKYFEWHELLYLPSWNRLADEQDGLTQEILGTLQLFAQNYMDKVRDFYASPIRVHCCYRPRLYNSYVGGAKSSCHLALNPSIAAFDFDVLGMGCEPARQLILPKLEEMGLRMEDNGVLASWVHLDNKPITQGMSRFFKP